MPSKFNKQKYTRRINRDPTNYYSKLNNMNDSDPKRNKILKGETGTDTEGVIRNERRR